MAGLIEQPRWDGGDGPRVLIEAAAWSHRQALSQVLQQHGFRTASCPGPEGADERCPLSANGKCNAATQADVVVHALRPTDERNREVLLALQRHHPSTRLIAEVPKPRLAGHPDDYESCSVVTTPMTACSLLDALSQEH